MYDIIGDIHGHADALEILLQKMKYIRKAGVYCHPDNRKVIFVGDFIDRGPKIRETLHLVKDMCDAGNAFAVMGNHEYNAICFHTPHLEKGGFFREHSLKEIEQHLETLKQFKQYSTEWDYFLNWFKELPLYYENDDFRVVHACWDILHINWIKNNYKGINKDFLSLATDRDNIGGVYNIIEETLKGKEAKLPCGKFFTDKDGTIRTECRVKWWSNKKEREKFGQILLGCPNDMINEQIPSGLEYYLYDDNKYVFFGHYWLGGFPTIDNTKAICLDYSVAKGGILVGCRTEKVISGLDIQFIY